MLMRHPLLITAACLMTLPSVEAHAQFYTVSSEKVTPVLSVDPFARTQTPPESVTKLRQNPSEKAVDKKKAQIPAPKKSLKTPEIPVFDVSDSLLLGLIKKRLSVCMPLDWIYLTSAYGYRKDPFSRCKRFHDGIDLRCNKQLVYNMLQGRVEKVGYGNTGYGNHIVTTHGHLRFLYGHLSEIYVHEGDIIDAGKIIARSGSSGRSSGPHMHLKMSRLTDKGWESVDPQPFIDALNKYIGEIDGMMEKMGCKETVPTARAKEPQPLNRANLFAALKRHGIKHPRIVLAQAILETGNFTSAVCRNKMNLFGLRNPRTGEYFEFPDWESSVIGYRDKVQYRYKGSATNESAYYSWLDRIGYAGSKDYIYKVREIAEKL